MLNALDLLRDGRQDTLLESIELVETSPCSDAAQTDKDAAHRLEVERLVTAEDDDKHAELHTQCLDRLGLTRTGWAKGSTSELVVERLCQRQVAAIGEGRLHEAVRNTEVLVTVREGRVGHLDGESVQRLLDLTVEVEAHLREPVEVAGGLDTLRHEKADDVPLMHKLGDEVLALASLQRLDVGQHRICEQVESAQNHIEGMLQTCASLKRFVYHRRPSRLHGKNDELRRILGDPS